MPNLTVYKASAGSGKTYTLTLRYLELLFRDEFAYRNILAVTFTNKAASEMKNRIMETLYKLSVYDPASAIKPAYLEHISKTYSISEDEVRRRSGHILNYILNDFSRFSVGTIDKFFQMVIRAFTREIGLQSGYNLELNSNNILSEAVDNLLYSMDENQSLREWLIQFAGEEIMEGRSFSINANLITLGKELFKENYRNLSRFAGDAHKSPEKIREYQKILSREIHSFRNNLTRIAKSAFDLIHASGLETDDFSGKKSGALNFFFSIVSSTKKGSDKYKPGANSQKAVDNPDAWFTKTSDKKDLITGAFNNGLNSLLKEAINYSETHFVSYSTAVEINRFLYAYGILADLSAKVKEITTEKNLFLLSDSSEFLNEIIADNEAPFVYEKAGNYFQNFMLDEFQDTSVFQWDNFRPLVLNGLAANHESLVVGDIKQSIYRWRNSDWKILAKEVQKAFPTFYQETHLQHNYRSSENIIRFNNSIFSVAPGLLRDIFLTAVSSSGESTRLSALADMITDAYAQSSQLIPEKSQGSGGYVKFTIFEKGIKKDEYLEKVREKLPETIIDLQKRGYHAGDIALLVRKGEEGKQLADILLEYKNKNQDSLRGFNFNVISNDSLYIYSNPAVQLLVAVMKRMRNPFDLLNEAFIKHEFLRYLNEGADIPEDFHLLFSGKSEDFSNSFTRVFKNLNDQHNQIRHLSLFELVERLCGIFELNVNKQDLPYIQAFQDTVLTFMKKDASDLNAFLDYWEDQGKKETLNISEQQDAIRIFTIHKAKGLEFRVVIVPFCNWRLEPSPILKNILWCETTVPPFNFMPFVPVVYGSALSNTIFSGDYYLEMLHSFVDNLNLSYVAFTRAIDELHVFSSPAKSGKHIGELLLESLQIIPHENNTFPFVIPEQVIQTQDRQYEYGSPKPLSAEGLHKDQIAEVFDYYPVSGFPQKLRLRYRSEEFFSQGTPSTGDIDYGIIMHGILEKVKYTEDLENAVKVAFHEGKIDSAKQKEIFDMLKGKLDSPPIEDLFSREWQVFAERDIITATGQEYRPDRVMVRNNKAMVVDYKFGSHENPDYACQLKRYMKLLYEIGYSEVKAYIWYVLSDTWEEVKHED